MTSILASATEEPTSGPVGPGLAGALVIAGLVLAMVFLYRSMRKQLKRIDFNPQGKSDQERMGGPGVTGNGGNAQSPAADPGEAHPHEPGTDGHRQP